MTLATDTTPGLWPEGCPLAEKVTPGLWPITEAEYFADVSHVSHSMIDAFREDREEYCLRFVAQTAPAPEPTKDMLLGTGLHTLILEPRKPIPGEVEKDRRLLEAMADAVAMHPLASRALSLQSHPPESVIRWRDKATGLPCKCKIDLACKNGLVVDLKSCKDSSQAGFAKNIANYGYARQGAHYLDGAWEALQLDGPFLWICVQKSGRFRVRCYQPCGDLIDHGRKQNAEAMAQLAECYRTGNWDSDANKVIRIDQPRWGYYQ